MKQELEWKPLAVAAASGAMILALLGFLVFGWKPAGVAEADSAAASKAAVVAALADICKDQFNNDPDVKANTVSMQAQSSFGQGTFLVSGGWATMPGSEKLAKEVGRSCADSLEIPHAMHPSEVQGRAGSDELDAIQRDR